jgi:integrase
VKLTDIFVKRKQGNGKVQKHSDGGGLFLYITPAGSKSWRLAYRFMGKQKLLVIGPYPEIGLKEARERRREAKRLLLDQIDPSAAKQEAKAAAANAVRNSFEIVAREWFEKYSGDWTQSYKERVQHRLEHEIFPYVGRRPVKSISAPELLAVLRKVENRGAVTAAHLAMRECGRIFRYAIVTGRAERDICADLRGAIKPAPAAKHYAAITEPRKIGKLLLALESYPGTFPVTRALRIAPFLFVRPGELAGAQWVEVNFETAEWRIPPERMKMRQPHIVPLSLQALAILRETHAVTGQGRFVFPNKSSREKSMGVMTLVTALRYLGYRPDEMTCHGFRSMASTLLNEKGYNSDWIERQLAHAERSSVRAAYNYAQYLPERRKMMQEYADYLVELKERARREAAA